MFQLRTLTALAVAAAGVATAAVLPTVLSTQEPAKPTPTHDQILKGAGEWVGTITMSYPGMEAMSSPATETVTGLGPFHTLSDFRCSIMGMDYEGHGTVSYDPEKKEMMTTWMDNSSPYNQVMRGTYDLDTGVSKMKWEAPGLTGEVVDHRSVMTSTDDAYEIKFYMDTPDGEIQSMTISMQRK